MTLLTITLTWWVVKYPLGKKKDLVLAGAVGMRKKDANPIRTDISFDNIQDLRVKSPSIRKSHCHPAAPAIPLILSRPTATNPLNMLAGY